jgi:hypothetical protein
MLPRWACAATVGRPVLALLLPCVPAWADEAATAAFIPSNMSQLLSPGSLRHSPGVRVGSFILQSSANAAIVYDDNVYATPEAGEADASLSVDAAVSAVSNWSNHALEFYASGGANFYSNLDSENSSFGNVGIAGRVDIVRGFYVKAFGNFSRAVEPRGSGESFQPLLEPIETETSSAGILVHKHFNRLWGELGVTMSEAEFFDARVALGTIDQSFRNGTQQEASVRLGYDVSPKTALFVEGFYDIRDYEDDRVDGEGFKFGTGVRYELTRVTSAEAAIGHRFFGPGTATFTEIESWYFRSQLRWDVSPLMTIAVVGSRDVGAPSQDGTGSNRINTEIGVRGDYAIKRNVTLFAGLGRGSVEYVDTGRNDEYLKIAAGAEYLFQPWLSLWSHYSHTDYSANTTPTIDYTKSVFSVGVRARY